MVIQNNSVKPLALSEPAATVKGVDLELKETEPGRRFTLTANFQPHDKTLFHTHRFPVTVYVLEGAFTLEMEGREPVTVKAGQAITMPAHVKMTGYNRSNTEQLRLVTFNVSDPGTPYLEPVH